MIHRCEFPGCDFESKYSRDLHKHHIKPKELGGSNKKLNLLKVCDRCHNRIHVPDSHICSRHNVVRDDSIIINGINFSTAGWVMFYTRMIDGFQGIHLLSFWRNTKQEKTLIDFKKTIEENNVN